MHSSFTVLDADLFLAVRYELVVALETWSGTRVNDAKGDSEWPLVQLPSVNIPSLEGAGDGELGGLLDSLLAAVTLAAPATFHGRRAAAWKLLFSPSEHGSSMNRLKHHVGAYSGPTICIVRERGDGGRMWMACVNEPWVEGSSGTHGRYASCYVVLRCGLFATTCLRVAGWGSSGCALVSLLPVQTRFEHTSPFGVFCEKSRTSKVGVGFGGLSRCNVGARLSASVVLRC